uniref:Protein-glutamine gamma-glutamyltransferase 2 n=1 Tax=Sphaeramia orbicularis TaxID=375764 RepID=A0A672ZN31_9TELE
MSQGLDIERCDLNIQINRNNHHTDQFSDPHNLIVRRGQTFSITLHLKPGSEEFNLGETTFSLIVETGTVSYFGFLDTDWSAMAYADPSNAVSVIINSSPNAPVGLYSLTLDQDGQKTRLGQFILLFNAWCEKDAVYMDGEERGEYVLKDYGLIYRGSPTQIKGLPWNFAQYEPEVLDICLKILGEKPRFALDTDQDYSKGDPIYVARLLSAVINSNDDRGVVVGEWYNFDGGVHPGTWTGSGEILHKWAESGPVRYGQCWVFAAISCTVFRALGIPCRVVTNFGSAHDSDASLVIENIYDEDGKRISDDSVWNFHVWVECWMMRPDLEEGFNGWQVSDPTPQETSEGIYCCGPVSQKAVKEGELTTKYDAAFVFAEVNADYLDCILMSDGRLVKKGGSTKLIGKHISTKAVGVDERKDITHEYKYPEGTATRSNSKFRKHSHSFSKQKIRLSLLIKLTEEMTLGSDFVVNALLTNNCMDVRNCVFQFSAKAVCYNGKKGEECCFTSDKVELSPGEEKHYSLKVEYNKYGPVITADRLIKLSAVVIDKTTVDISTAERTIILDEPDIEIKVRKCLPLLGDIQVNNPVTAELTLLNPLPEPLQDCSFTAVGAGLTDSKPIIIKIGTVPPKEEAKASVEFTPTSAGSKVLLISFDSDKLKNIKLHIDIDVKE